MPPDGAAAELIRETGAGVIAPPDDVEALKNALAELHEQFVERRAAGDRDSGGDAPPALASRPRRGARRARSLAVTRARPGPVVDALFFATVFTVTFAKLQWKVAGTLSLSDVLTAVFLIAFAGTRLGTGDRRLAWGAAVAALFFLALPRRLPGRLLQPRDRAGARAVGEGDVRSSCSTSCSSSSGSRTSSAGASASTGPRSPCSWPASSRTRVYGIVQLGTAEVLGINLDQSVLSPITGGASQINIYGAIGGESVFRPNALTGDPNHLGIELVIPLLVLTPLYLRLEKGHRLKVPLALLLAFLLVVELATLSRSGLLGLGAGLLVLAVPVPAEAAHAGLPPPARRRRGRPCAGARGALGLLRAGSADAHRHVGQRDVDALRRLRLHPGCALRRTRSSGSG